MHIGLIMDGNGRWAQKRGLPRDAGHIEGMKALKRIIRYSATVPEVDCLTLYVFSTENWRRPQVEVKYLMNLLASRTVAETPFLKENGVRILVRGDLSGLPQKPREALEKLVADTAGGKNLTCVLAVNYGGQDEIVRSVNRFIQAHPGQTISADDIRENMDVQVPPPDIIARSAGELRLSNFLLWDSAYAEIYSSPDLWPDWDSAQIDEVIRVFKSRNRRFGGL